MIFLFRKTAFIIGGPGAGKQVIFAPIADSKSILVDVSNKVAAAQAAGLLSLRSTGGANAPKGYAGGVKVV